MTSKKKPIKASEWDGDWNAVFEMYSEIYDAAMDYARRQGYGSVTKRDGNQLEGSVDFTFESGNKVDMEQLADGTWQFY